MKNYILALLCAATAAISSCNTVSPYSTDPCKISISIADGTPTASYVLANFVTEGDVNYYYANVATKEEFNKATNHERFMQLCLDWEYVEYVNWRYDLLVDNAEYVTDFASHSLYYGSDSRYFRDLNPSTEYFLYAFCVNPETNQPIGPLYYVPFTTGDLKQSDITFQAMFKEREDGAHISVIPSNDNEHYVWTFEDVKTLEESHLSIKDYAQIILTEMKEYGMGESLYTKGPDTYVCTPEDLLFDHDYTLVAAGFDGEFTTDIYTLDFHYPFTDEGPFYLGPAQE